MKPPGEEDSEAGHESGVSLLPPLHGQEDVSLWLWRPMLLQLAAVPTLYTAIYKTVGSGGRELVWRCQSFQLFLVLGSRVFEKGGQVTMPSQHGHLLFPLHSVSLPGDLMGD